MSLTSTDIWSEQIERLIAARNPIVGEGGTLQVSTDVTMPSGTGVVVLVCGGRSGETVSVSDGGAAIREVRELGYSLREADLGVIRRAAIAA